MNAEQSAVSRNMNTEEQILSRAEALASGGQWKEAAFLL